MQVLILHNDATSGRIDDLDTLQQLTEITALLQRLGCDVSSAVCRNLMDVECSLLTHRPDIVFNLVESFGNSDATAYLVKAFLEMRKIPCTGCTAESMFLTGNKPLAKRIMRMHHIPTPLSSTDDGAPSAWRYIVKSTNEQASFGMDAASVVHSMAEASALIQHKKSQHGGEWFAEHYIDGREINVALLEKNNHPYCLPPTEICFESSHNIHIVDYAAKWHTDSEAYRGTVRQFVSHSDDTLLIDKLNAIALQCWHSFGLTGYARVDFRVDAAGNPWVLEVNANPCLSANAGFMAAAIRSELTPLTVIQYLLGKSFHESNAITKTLCDI